MGRKRIELVPQVLHPLVLVGDGGFRDVVHQQPCAVFVPQQFDDGAQARVLEVRQLVGHRRHGHHDADQHVGFFVVVFDDLKGVEANVAVFAKLDEIPADVLAQLFVGPADVDGPNGRPGADVGGDDVVGQERFARTRRGHDGRVVIGVRVEQVDAHQHAGPRHEIQHRRAGPRPVADDRHELDRVAGCQRVVAFQEPHGPPVGGQGDGIDQQRKMDVGILFHRPADFPEVGQRLRHLGFAFVLVVGE